jgi:hypothetical protein
MEKEAFARAAGKAVLGAGKVIKAVKATPKALKQTSSAAKAGTARKLEKPVRRAKMQFDIGRGHYRKGARGYQITGKGVKSNIAKQRRAAAKKTLAAEKAARPKWKKTMETAVGGAAIAAPVVGGAYAARKVMSPGKSRYQGGPVLSRYNQY